MLSVLFDEFGCIVYIKKFMSKSKKSQIKVGEHVTFFISLPTSIENPFFRGWGVILENIPPLTSGFCGIETK